MVRSLLLLFALAGTLAAADPKPAIKLREALDATGDVVFEDKSLIELAEYFKVKLKAEVRFDYTAIVATGLDPNAPIHTVKIRSGKVRDGIKTVLAPHNLFTANVGGTLFIGTEADVLARQMRQRVSVDGEATTLSAVLKSLADETGTNVTIDPRIASKAGTAAVKLKLDDVPLETAVRLTAEVAEFSVVRMNNVLFVTSEERAAKLAAVADPPTPVAAPPAPAFPFGPPPAMGFGGLGRPEGGRN
jgi:hypothetical protein